MFMQQRLNLHLPHTPLLSLAHFPVSRFTSMGRNDHFIRFLFQGVVPDTRQTVYLLGSGPIEPFSVALIREACDSKIIAIDADGTIINILQHALRTSCLSFSKVRLACGIREDVVFEGPAAQVDEPLPHDQPWPSSLIAATSERITVYQLDLTRQNPMYVEGPKIIFSGFLLVNIAKTRNGKKRCRKIITDIYEGLSEYGIFATCTSYGFLRDGAGYSSNLIDLLTGCRLSMVSGVLNRIALASEGLTTSFGIFASREQDVLTIPRALTFGIERKILNNGWRHGLKINACTGCLHDLKAKLNSKSAVVLAFFLKTDTLYHIFFTSREYLNHQLYNGGHALQFTYDEDYRD